MSLYEIFVMNSCHECLNLLNLNIDLLNTLQFRHNCMVQLYYWFYIKKNYHVFKQTAILTIAINNNDKLSNYLNNS